MSKRLIQTAETIAEALGSTDDDESVLKRGDVSFECVQVDTTPHALSKQVLAAAQLRYEDAIIGTLLAVQDDDEPRLLAITPDGQCVFDKTCLDSEVFFELVRSARTKTLTPDDVLEILVATEADDPTVDLHQLHDSWGGQVLGQALWAALPEFRRRLGTRSERVELDLTQDLACAAAPTESVAAHLALVGRAGKWEATYCRWSYAKRYWSVDLEDLVRNTKDRELLVELVAKQPRVAKTFIKDLTFAAARYGAAVDPELERYVDIRITHHHEDWPFEGAECIQGWTTLLARKSELPSDTLALLRALGNAPQDKRDAILGKLDSAADVAAALARYVEEIAEKLRTTQQACYSISDRSWVMTNASIGALMHLPAETIRTLVDHPELRFCARGLLERNSGAKTVLLDLLSQDEREALVISVVEEAGHDQLSGILSILPFQVDDIGRSKEFEALEHLVEGGHAVSDLKAYRHIVIVFGYDLGPARQRAVCADLESFSVDAEWREVRFQGTSNLGRRPMRRLKTAEEAKFEKDRVAGALLVEHPKADSDALGASIVAAARRLKRDKKKSKASKAKSTGQLAALWADAVCRDQGWTLLMYKRFGRYEHALVSPRHRSVLLLTDVQERLSKPKSALMEANEGPNAQPFQYRQIYL